MAEREGTGGKAGMGSDYGDLLEAPEAWARGFIEYVVKRLKEIGFQGMIHPYDTVYASIAAGHITGLDYFYEYAIDSYYTLVDGAEEVRPLAEPRWAKLLPYLDEDVEALAAFEERLADSSTVLCAEPILAAALLGLATGSRPSGWSRVGYTGRPGAYPVLVRRDKRKCRILVPSPIYSFSIAAMAALGLQGPGQLDANVPDPALLRKTVYESRVAYAELSNWLRGLVEELAREALSTRDACTAERLLKIRYRYLGVLEAEYIYLC